MLFRCAKVKYRSKQCERQLQIVYLAQDSFSVQHNGKLHTCIETSQANKSKPQLEKDLIERIQSLFRSGTRMPKQVQSALRDDRSRGDIFYESEPTINQIIYQVMKYKAEIMGKGEISLGELKKFLEQHSTVPENIDEPFVLGFSVKMAKRKLLEISENEDTDYEPDEDDPLTHRDETEFEIPSFWFLFSTVRLLNQLPKTRLLAADSTFKLVWQGFSGVLIGTVDMKKQFHKICFGMSTSEKTSDWSEMFQVSLVCFKF